MVLNSWAERIKGAAIKLKDSKHKLTEVKNISHVWSALFLR